MIFDDPIAWMRSDRNICLRESDWTQMPDVSLTTEKKAEWAQYRLALRDLPSTAKPKLDKAGHLTGVTWPTKPV